VFDQGHHYVGETQTNPLQVDRLTKMITSAVEGLDLS
jgi:hypothetical protein